MKKSKIIAKSQGPDINPDQTNKGTEGFPSQQKTIQNAINNNGSTRRRGSELGDKESAPHWQAAGWRQTMSCPATANNISNGSTNWTQQRHNGGSMIPVEDPLKSGSNQQLDTTTPAKRYQFKRSAESRMTHTYSSTGQEPVTSPMHVCTKHVPVRSRWQGGSGEGTKRGGQNETVGWWRPRTAATANNIDT